MDELVRQRGGGSHRIARWHPDDPRVRLASGAQTSMVERHVSTTSGPSARLAATDQLSRTRARLAEPTGSVRCG